jgi:hypothetical protein
MQLVALRTISSIDSQSLTPQQAREALFRANGDRFVLYLADGSFSSASEERVIFLDLREALIWLNEPVEQRGSFWT